MITNSNTLDRQDEINMPYVVCDRFHDDGGHLFSESFFVKIKLELQKDKKKVLPDMNGFVCENLGTY